MDSKAKDHIRVLERRLAVWRRGDINSLVCEGRALQAARLVHRKQHCSDEEEHFASVFARLMMQGKLNAALRWISDHRNGAKSKGVLPLDQTVDSSG